MNKKGQGIMAMVVPVGVTLILGVIIVAILFGQTSTATGTTAVSEDQFTAATSCVRVTSDCLLAGTTTDATNQTGIDVSGNLTACGDVSGDYGYASTAELVGQTLNVSYTEVSCGHVTGLTGTIVNYLPLLLAVALLVFLAGFLAMR